MLKMFSQGFRMEIVQAKFRIPSMVGKEAVLYNL